jgi:hypothetical protein
MKGGTMSNKAGCGAVIGLLVGGGLGFLVVTGAYSESDNKDVANYAFMYGIMFSPLVALVGGLVGAAIGAVVGRKAD